MSDLLREFAEAIREHGIVLMDTPNTVKCAMCGNDHEYETLIKHDKGCEYEKACAYLAANPVGEEPREWLDKPDSEGRWLRAWISEGRDERMDLFVVHVANLEGYRPGLYTHTKSHVDSFVPSKWKKIIFPDLPKEETKP